MITEKSLHEYYKILYPGEDHNTVSTFDELFLKVYGKTYSQHLKEEEDFNKQIERKEYENIPQRILIMN